MKTILVLLIVGISFSLWAQNGEPKNTAQPKSNPGASSNANLFNNDPLFRINFKSKPTKASNDVETEVGIVKMVSYMVEKPNFAYMVAYSTYPAGHITTANTPTMLENAMGGFMNNLQMTLVEQKNISLQQYQGVIFKASSDIYYAVVADYLVQNTLFQIGIMRSDRYPTQNEINNFIYSFELK